MMRQGSFGEEEFIVRPRFSIAALFGATTLFLAPISAAAQEILPASDERDLNYYEMSGFGEDAAAILRIARNEIFARHGRRFSSPDLQAHFNAQDWYRPSDAEIVLNSWEIRNVNKLAELEARIGNRPLAFNLLGRDEGLWSAIRINADGSSQRVNGGPQGMLASFDEANNSIILHRPTEGTTYAAEPGQSEYASKFGPGVYPIMLDPSDLLYLGVEVIETAPGSWQGEQTRILTLHSAPGEYDQAFLSGRVELTADGIVVRADLQGVHAPQGQDEWQSWSARFELRDLVRGGAYDPALFDWPESIETMIAPG
jgi:hypothetical protein